MKTIRELNLENKKVLLRVDFNVPIKNNQILDDARIISALDTINYLLEKNAKIIILSHLGRIKEEKDKEKNSLSIVSKRLGELLNKKIIFINNTRGKTLEDKISTMKNKDILLMENTRFEDYPNKLESNNDEKLGKYWASLGDVFINDAFATLHRKHASNVGIASNIKEKGIGFLVEKELYHLEEVIENKNKLTLILGGSKVKDKLELINNLIADVEQILIGGGMANTFLKAKGIDIGKSIYEKDLIETCKDILNKYGNKIILPIDYVLSDNISNKPINDNIRNLMILDIGEKTIELFKNNLKDKELVFWNGPLGVYENKYYANGTNKILEFLVKNNIKTVLGGGDIVAASKKYADKLYYVSTGGGASLEFLAKSNLPGLEEMK